MTIGSKPSRKAAFRGPGLLETIREGLLGRRRPLDCVQVEVSSRCLGRCGYCPRTVLGADWRSRDMDLAVFQRLWPLMRISHRVHLQGWGEPLSSPVFFEMAALARRAGCAVSTTTSGLPMDRDLAWKIVDSGIDIAAFSLAGANAADNDFFRRGVDFHRVCEAISMLQDVRRARQGVHLEIHIAYLLMASRLDSVRGLPDLMRRLGVHAAVVGTLDYLPRPELKSEAIGPADEGRLAAAAAVLAETAAEAAALGLDFYYFLPRQGATGTVCHENIRRSLFVSAQGLASPCVYVNLAAPRPDIRRLVFGDVADQDPLAIWNSEEYRRFRDRLAAGDPAPVCLDCPKRFID
ncbi:MAG: SPASM domain-containing protein [Pseudomonadota bacterium]